MVKIINDKNLTGGSGERSLDLRFPTFDRMSAQDSYPEFLPEI